jgi:hypothetical protein
MLGDVLSQEVRHLAQGYVVDDRLFTLVTASQLLLRLCPYRCVGPWHPTRCSSPLTAGPPARARLGSPSRHGNCAGHRGRGSAPRPADEARPSPITVAEGMLVLMASRRLGTPSDRTRSCP